ncbi:hypothetical protein [Actinomadura sp. NTSP31]|uniref:hypothetical protein n=1 Tax=Actinomadura sp. NTSP31 TaxID=1735447 RepID=UPI0035C237E4
MRGKPSRRRYQQKYQRRLLEQHANALARVRALANADLADEQLCRSLALWVRAYRHANGGQGPAWSLIAQHARPTLTDTDTQAPGHLLLAAYAERLITGLKQRRWLNHDHRPGSTRQGPRLYEEGTLPAKHRRIAPPPRPDDQDAYRRGRHQPPPQRPAPADHLAVYQQTDR